MKQLQFRKQICWLCLLVVAVITIYLSYQTYGNWQFALALRGRKLVAFIVVGVAASCSTIAFQTVTHNRFLTPGILGVDQLYVLVQTLLFFFLGGRTVLQEVTSGQFLLNIFLMAVFSTSFILFFLGRSGNDLFRLLMVGLVATSMFSSISTFLQVLMDPNEYDLLQGRLFASFGNVQTTHLLLASGSLLVIVGFLWYLSPELDVLHLGFDQGVNLGLSLQWLQRGVLFLIAAATGIATALVGPTLFLGFVVATISYQVFASYDHRRLFLGSSLLAILLLVAGQFIVEQLLGLKVTIGTIIQFLGGLFFIGKIIMERKKV